MSLRNFLLTLLIFSTACFVSKSKIKLQLQQKKTFDDFFYDVQMQQVFDDQKTFPDCIPLFSEEQITSDYNQQYKKSNFDLSKFVLERYNLPSSVNETIIQHINRLWDVLKRPPDTMPENNSKINLNYSYIVPGGRFRDIYYWDSYFTMLGLQVSGKDSLVQDMLLNMKGLLNRFGYIPNGNRNYFLGRSQPPFFSLMVKEFASNPIDFLPDIQ